MTNAKHLQFDPSELERNELETKVKTDQDDYSPDTQGDPEGSEARSLSRSDFPDWVFTDFDLSRRDYYGKPYPGEEMHLIPKRGAIEEIFDIHMQGITDEEQMTNCLVMGGKEHDFTEIKDAYLSLINALPEREQYNAMRGLSSATEEALAQRAILKYRFLSTADRGGNNEEYLEKLHTQALQASARAGLYVLVHRELWKFLQWKGEPKYDRSVQRAIEWAQVRSSQYIEDRHGSTEGRNSVSMTKYNVAF